MVMTASGGLVLLYLVTTTDPGCIPRGSGQDPDQKPHEKAKSGSARERYSNYRHDAVSQLVASLLHASLLRVSKLALGPASPS